jgi:hypothetical protein
VKYVEVFYVAAVLILFFWFLIVKHKYKTHLSHGLIIPKLSDLSLVSSLVLLALGIRKHQYYKSIFNVTILLSNGLIFLDATFFELSALPLCFLVLKRPRWLFYIALIGQSWITMEFDRRGIAIINFVYLLGTILSTSDVSTFFRRGASGFLLLVLGTFTVPVYVYLLFLQGAPLPLSEIERYMLFANTVERLCLIGSSNSFCWGPVGASIPLLNSSFTEVSLPSSTHTILLDYAAYGVIPLIIIAIFLIHSFRSLPLNIVLAFCLQSGLMGIGVFNILFYISIIILHQDPRLYHGKRYLLSK